MWRRRQGRRCYAESRSIDDNEIMTRLCSRAERGRVESRVMVVGVREVKEVLVGT